MGCLNADQNFEHCFGNIHLSGPCNRSCYFCIGQYMPGQDMNNNLSGELLGLEKFTNMCRDRKVTEVNITGTNTDPLLRRDISAVLKTLRLSGFTNIGMRTNGVKTSRLVELMPLLDKVSISITSFNSDLYKKTMGSWTVPDIAKIVRAADEHGVFLKLNVVLCPETVNSGDIYATVHAAEELGIEKINFREPYGQTHIGDPFAQHGRRPDKVVFGNPCYFSTYGVQCTYWDVHYTEVESINLYADGKVSTDYPITLGHSEEHGDVKDVKDSCGCGESFTV